MSFSGPPSVGPSPCLYRSRLPAAPRPSSPTPPAAAPASGPGTFFLQPTQLTATSRPTTTPPSSRLPISPLHSMMSTGALLEPPRPRRTGIISPPMCQLNLAGTGQVGDEQLLPSGARGTEHEIAPI